MPFARAKCRPARIPIAPTTIAAYSRKVRRRMQFSVVDSPSPLRVRAWNGHQHVRILVVRPAMRSCIFVQPVFFLPGRSVSARDLANRACLVLRTGFRAVAERFLTVLFLPGIPLVDGYFHRHPAAPDAAVAEILVSPDIEAAMTSGAVGRQIRGHAKPRRRRKRLRISGYVPDSRGPVVVDSLQFRIRDRLDFRRETPSGAEAISCMSCRADPDPDLLLLVESFDQQGIAWIIVLALVEGSQQPDARLDCNDAALHACLQHPECRTFERPGTAGVMVSFRRQGRVNGEHSCGRPFPHPSSFLL